MLKINTKKHLNQLNIDFKEAIKRINELANDEKLKEIINIAVDWYEKGGVTYVSFFGKVIGYENATEYYGGLASFLANCILDDSYYEVKWKRYILEDGGYKRGRAWKDIPYVVWAGYETGTNKPDLMLKAMKFKVKEDEEWEKFCIE